MISFLYYLLCAFIAVLMIRNFLKSKKWEEEVLYLIILMPFILRLLRLK
jgi:hypothetical protein